MNHDRVDVDKLQSQLFTSQVVTLGMLTLLLTLIGFAWYRYGFESVLVIIIVLFVREFYNVSLTVYARTRDELEKLSRIQSMDEQFDETLQNNQ